ncbi:piggyBac transposable element-derived protein 4-like [Conger conger]|uniref:piggyBac transposable element-derived protein 4-like n=1 Tax=Conger conger TaxID=82655 RepID=UPI002A5A7998|nr:piggyBac transposable element-derived protein 4-like [Conger conger]
MAEIKPEIMTQADIKIEDSSDSATMNEIASQTLDQVYDDHNAKDEDEKYVPPPRISPRRRLERSPSASSSSSSDGSGGGQASKRPRLAAGDFEAQQERWHSKEEPDVEPPTLKFEPKHPPGPRIDTTVNWSPLSLFKLFFSSSVQHTIINNTNGNAARRLAQGARYKWSPLSVDKFYIFLSIILFSGLARTHSRADYWRREWPYNFSFPKSTMSRDRFEAIFWSLHLSDVTEDEENEKKRGTPQFDKLFKIKPLYGEIVNTCNSLFQPNKDISVDERMVASKARIGFRQYMKDKPTKCGYKLFVLADSKTGYTCNFFVYQGKDESKVKQRGPKEDGLSLSVTSVMDLMRFDLLGKGYHLYVDNFYTSPVLFNKLAQNHIAACGTIRANREGFPRTTTNDFPKNPERGDMRWIRKGNLLFVRWVDTKIVNVCSSFHKAYSGATTLRKLKGADGQWQRGVVHVPDACKDYNMHMGGVDLSDALINYYSVHGKTMRWYKTFFYHFIDIAVVNSYILHKAVASTRNQTPLSHKRFREVLMREMVEQAKAIVAEAAPRPSLTNTCMPVYRGKTGTQDRRKCVVCATKAKQMPGSKAKEMKTPIYCSKCNVSLCLVPERNCFLEYHGMVLQTE